MILMTTVGAIEVVQQLNTSLDRVVLFCKDVDTLREVIASLELTDVSEDNPGSAVGEIVHIESRDVWSLEMDRTTFKLWFNFELDHFVNYGKNEFPEPACWNPEYTTQVKSIKKELGLA